MTVNIEYETDIDIKLDYEDIITKVVEQSVDYEKCPYEVEVNVTLTDNESIHQINKEYRDVDSPTDVLSFPMIEYDAPADFDALEDELENNAEAYFNPDSGELLLGDIVVSVEKVFEQAEKYGHSTTRELAFLVAHSMMHLFGYDHMEEAEAKIMEAKQSEVLDLLGIGRDCECESGIPRHSESLSEGEVSDVDFGEENKLWQNTLFVAAKSALEFAYAPYSNFKVGAAVLTESGKVYIGCNIENVSFGATNCAERTAIFKAVSEGEKRFKAIAIASSSGKATYPCGICRQVMAEFMDKDSFVIVEADSGEGKIELSEGLTCFKLEDLLPHSFDEF